MKQNEPHSMMVGENTITGDGHSYHLPNTYSAHYSKLLTFIIPPNPSSNHMRHIILSYRLHMKKAKPREIKGFGQDAMIRWYYFFEILFAYLI